MSSKYRKPDQIIQPWQYGHGECKSTCLWLKNLPKLKSTNIVSGREKVIWEMWHDNSIKKEDLSKMRSKTYKGIANAMADQWGNILLGKRKYRKRRGFLIENC